MNLVPAGSFGGNYVNNYMGGGTVVFAGDLVIDSDGSVAKGVAPLDFNSSSCSLPPAPLT